MAADLRNARKAERLKREAERYRAQYKETAHILPPPKPDPALVMIPVASLGLLRVNPSASPEYMQALREAFELAACGNGEWPPPVILLHSGTGIQLFNGQHRLIAARAAGVAEIPAYCSSDMKKIRAVSLEQDRNRKFQRT